ncbi:MAG TPA: CopG family transcriptional regulator [Candidatus Acidoferrum sp.]|nr:CopG family transcriptional regulator [Candidatus Acidoferrum sp.]
MSVLKLKISPELEAVLKKASRTARIGKSELIRRALVAYIARQVPIQFVSALEKAGDLAGCFAGGPKDLSTSSRHMNGFGKRH